MDGGNHSHLALGGGIYVLTCNVQDWTLQCPSNAIWARLLNTPLSKKSFKTQPQYENEDITWSPRYHMLATTTNKRRTLSLQEVELDGWLFILHIGLKTFTIKSCTSLMWVCIPFLYSWIHVLDLNQPFNRSTKIQEPFKMKLVWGLQSRPLFTW